MEHSHFHEKNSTDEPVILILNNHSSHISLAVINKCWSVDIELSNLPPYSSHRLQLLYGRSFGLHKIVDGQECEKWYISHVGRAITQGELYGKVIPKVP